MIDTHCHLTYPDLATQIDRVIHAAQTRGVDRMITVATSPSEYDAALALTDRFPGAVFPAAGLHPHYAHQWTDRSAVTEPMRALAAGGRIVALGEMGLDRHYPDPPLEDQRRAFNWQLELACELDAQGHSLPIIIHNRQATDDTLAIIRASALPGHRFVFHCFTGDDRELDAILALGAMVSFTGIVTFASTKTLAASSDRVPLDRLMIETDSPYLTPEPHRKIRPNQPAYVADVAAFLAQRRGMTIEAFTDATDENAQRFFANLESSAHAHRVPGAEDLRRPSGLGT